MLFALFGSICLNVKLTISYLNTHNFMG